MRPSRCWSSALLALAACSPAVDPAVPPAGTAPAATTGAAPTATTPAAPPPPAFAGLPDVPRPPGWKAALGPCDKRCEAPHVFPEAAFVPNAPMAMFELDTGTTGAHFAFDPRIDLFLWVVDGEIAVTLDQGGPTREVKAWQVVRARGGGCKVDAKASARVVGVAARIDGKPHEAPSRVFIQYKASDREPLAFADVRSGEHLAWGKGAFHFQAGHTTSAASVNALFAAKTAPVPEHVHDKEWECLFALDGEGELVLDGGERVPMGPGAKACVPAGKKHAWQPKGTRPLVAVQAYSPPGPEQRFKKLAQQEPR